MKTNKSNSDLEKLKKEVLEIADYLGCNGEELWSEVSKLLLRQNAQGQRDLLDKCLAAYPKPKEGVVKELDTDWVETSLDPFEAGFNAALDQSKAVLQKLKGEI